MVKENRIRFIQYLEDNVLEQERGLILRGAVKLESQIQLHKIVQELYKDITEKRRRDLKINNVLSILESLANNYLECQDILAALLSFRKDEDAKSHINCLINSYIDIPEEVVSLLDEMTLSYDNSIGSNLSYDGEDPTVDKVLLSSLNTLILTKIIYSSEDVSFIYRLSNNYWLRTKNIIRESLPEVFLLDDNYISAILDGLNIYAHIYVYQFNQRDKRGVIISCDDIEKLINLTLSEYDLAIDASCNICTITDYNSYITNKLYPLEDYDIDYKNIDLSSNRIGILLHGEPGTGKTCWGYSYYHKILKPLGYVLIVLNYDNYKKFNLNCIGLKVCLLINDIDYIENKKSRAEVLSRLEMEYSKNKIRTIFTANTIEELDPAFLREGRIDYQFTLHRQFV